jgi:membrane dipeptidase
MGETEIAHEDLLVIDGLVFFSDGDAGPLRDGNVAAANVTAIDVLSGLEQAIDMTASWLARLAEPDCRWKLVRAADDILAARQEGRVGLIMGWQNTSPLGDRIDRIRLFHALGVRVMQLTYNEANLIGDGCLEPRQSGLSQFGRDAVAEMNKVGIAIDLSHCSEPTCLDAARVSSKPVLLTHANARAVSDRPRNKSDEVLRAVADTGGVIGASLHGFMNWNGDPNHPPTVESFIEHVRHIVNLVGTEHVGMGHDMASVGRPDAADGILAMSKNKYAGAAGDFAAAFGNTLEKRYPAETPSPRELGRVTLALAKAGFKASEIEAISGNNFLRVFREIWH